MAYLASTYRDLMEAHRQIKKKIDALQRDLSHIDATLRILRGGISENDSTPQIPAVPNNTEKRETLQERVERMVPIGIATTTTSILASLKSDGVIVSKNPRKAYNRVNAVLVESPLFKRTDRGIYQRIAEPVLIPPNETNSDLTMDGG